MSGSIAKRLIGAVLLLELLTAAGIIVAVALHEKHLQYRAFDANLRAEANALLGAVQEDLNDTVQLDSKGLKLSPRSVYRVTDENGRVLGEAGTMPAIAVASKAFEHAEVNGRSYRFFAVEGQRVIDPERDGGIRHRLTVVFGDADGHVRHEVTEAVEFVAGAALGLLTVTTLLLVWLIRRLLSPIRELAESAAAITSKRWTFDAPPSADAVVELRPLTNALQQTLARLQLAFEEQKRFTNDAAHELKTDLAIVKSSFQLLMLKRRSEDEYERGIGVGLNDLTRLERTVQRMLTLARLEQTSESGAQSCRLDEVMGEAIQQSQSLADLRTITFARSHTAEISVPLPKRDALLLCANVLVNAVQHSLEHGRVEIEVSAVGEQAQVSVRDYGEGLQSEDLLLVFEPFYRADSSRSRKTGGTGLGLSICRAICERAGGSIELENHAEGGVVATILLPRV